MLHILSKIPVFVWPLLGLLIFGGLKARKQSKMPLPALLTIPCIFFCWTLYSFFGRFGFGFVSTSLWILCLGIGFLTGFTHMQKLDLQFDRKKKMVIMPGSLVPLLLSLSIFSSKFSVGMINAEFPHLAQSPLVLGIELFATFILGIFAGRGVGCLVKYKSSFQPE